MRGPRYRCSGEARAHAAGEGDMVECFVCEQQVPSVACYPVSFVGGQAVVCLACHERIEEIRWAQAISRAHEEFRLRALANIGATTEREAESL